MFGFITEPIEKQYTKDESTVTIRIIADSPMIQSMMMVFSNPMLAASEGGRLKLIKSQRAVVKYSPNDKSGNISVIVANKYMIQIDGNSVNEQVLMDYAESIDYDGLKKL